VFTVQSKSELGYGFLAVTDTGRFKDYSCVVRLNAHGEALGGTSDNEAVPGAGRLREEFERQLAAVQYEILEGPGRTMRWSVPDGTRDAATGELLHDDLVLSAALCYVLDGQTFPTGQGAFIIRGRDPLQEMDASRF
jgi:hypothetical protein